MRRLLILLGPTALLVLVPGLAHAEDFPDPVFDDTSFDGGGGEAFPPGWFVALAVLVVLGGIAMTLYRVSVARDLASRSGLDPDEAARATLLSEDGFGAAYLASQLRAPSSQPSATPQAGRTTEDRLRELDRLRGEGLVTDTEYAERRAAILDDL